MTVKKNLTVRLDDETREILQLIADREMRPLANQINFFIKQGMDAYLADNSLAITVNSEDQSLSLTCFEKGAGLHTPYDEDL